MPLPFDQPPKSLCILRLSAIGDCVHTTAVVRAIQDQWPDCKITWIIGSIEYQLLKGLDNVEFIVFNKKDGLSGMINFARQLKNRQFEVLLNMQIALRASVLSLFIKSPIKLGFDKRRAKDYQWLFTNARIPYTAKQHAMEALFEFAKAIGVENIPKKLTQQDIRWDIPIPIEDTEFILHTLEAFGHQAKQPVLVINPCTSNRSRNWRNWQAKYYAQVAQHAMNYYGATIVLSGGNSEIERTMAREILSHMPPNSVLNLIGKTSLKQLLALLKMASVVVSPDTGPAHISTAVGTPVIGLYATSNPLRTGPYLSLAHTVNTYPAALKQFNNTDIEHAKWGQRVRHPDAMDLIEVDAVIKQLNELWIA